MSFELKEKIFRSDIRLKFCTQWVMRHWNRWPREAVDVQSLEMPKMRLDEDAQDDVWAGRGRVN